MALTHSAYFDASSSKKLLTVAGGVAPVEFWKKFERDWKKILVRERVSTFHATDFAASKGEYTGWKGDRARRAQFLHDLGIVIRNHVSFLFAVGVELDGWEAVNQHFQLAERFRSPYGSAGFSVVEQVLNLRKRNRTEGEIQFFFENGDRGWNGLKALCAERGATPERLSKSACVPFQMGDMLAWKHRIAFTNALGHIPPQGASVKELVRSLEQLRDEYTSLEKVLVIDGTPKIMSKMDLVDTCRRHNIPSR